MDWLRIHGKGILLCLLIALPAWFLGELLPIIGGPIFAILIGLLVALIPKPDSFLPGIRFTSKKVLQYSIVLLGFGMNLTQIFQTGQQSLLVIVCTIAVSLVVAFLLSRVMKIPGKTATLIGVGSSICGGSAVAATAPVIGADDEEVAQAISTIFLFNVIAAFIFPYIGMGLGMTDQGFGMFAGTAVNDTSSVVAAATTWSNAAGNTAALSYATVVKLTRTLAIIPITLVLALWQTKRQQQQVKVKMSRIFPWFILFFLLAAVITTLLTSLTPLQAADFNWLSTLGKFLIVMAMAAIGLNTNIVSLIKNGGKAILLGLCCWVSIAGVSLLVQHLLGIW